MFKGKQVLVAGGTGLIGIPLVKMLVDQGARVRIVSLDDPVRAHPAAEFLRLDLRSPENCRRACAGIQFVFNLLCVKGSPAVTTTRPASFFVPMLLFNTNLMDAAYQSGAEGFLFASSIAVYAPAEVFFEDEVWKTFPSPNDRFAGWAKRMGELQAEAYKTEHNWNNITIVRPANVYGPYDNFDSVNAMVVPSLITRVVSGETPMGGWGDGLMACEKAPGAVLNLGSGVGLSIKQLVEAVVGQSPIRPEIVWDTSKPLGDRKRIMDVSRAKAVGFEAAITIESGVREVTKWYADNRNETGKRYDIFDGAR